MSTANTPLQGLTLEWELCGNRLLVRTNKPDDSSSYKFTLERNGERVLGYHPIYNNTGCFYLGEAGEYVVKAAALHDEEVYARGKTEPVVFAGKSSVQKHKHETPHPLSALKKLVTEVWTHRETMFRIAFYDYGLRNKDSRLGKLWSFINPLIQVLTYWLVFGLGLRSGQPVDGHPFLLWMLCGLIPWFFINAAIVDGCAAIHAKAGMVLKMQYPLATLPVKSTLTAFFEHIITTGILLVVTLCMGYAPTWNWFNILYYQLYSIIFLSALALVTSTLTMLARDYQKLVMALIRLLFYVTPILWTPERMPANIQSILRLNPIFYIVDGYRNSLLYQQPFWAAPKQMAFFWAVALLLLIAGSWLHFKYRDRFNDML